MAGKSLGPEFDLTAKGRKLLEKIFSMPIPAKAPMTGTSLKAMSVTLRTIGSEMAERGQWNFPPTICPKHTSFDPGNAMIVMELAAVWARSDKVPEATSILEPALKSGVLTARIRRE